MATYTQSDKRKTSVVWSVPRCCAYLASSGISKGLCANKGNRREGANMASRITTGSRVSVKADGSIGTVTNLETVKQGTRGRPPLVATVQTDSGQGNYRLSELSLA